MELWGTNHPDYCVISTPTMSFITPFGMVCTPHFTVCVCVCVRVFVRVCVWLVLSLVVTYKAMHACISWRNDSQNYIAVAIIYNS